MQGRAEWLLCTTYYKNVDRSVYLEKLYCSTVLATGAYVAQGIYTVYIHVYKDINQAKGTLILSLLAYFNNTHQFRTETDK